MANMVGNAGQDLGALSGIAGSAGVALGQMAEYAADANLAGEGLGSVLGSMGKVALPIAGIAVGVQLVTSAMAKSKAEAEALEKAIDAFSDSLGEAVGAADELDDAISEAFEAGRGNDLAVVAKSFQDAIDPDKIDEYREALSALDLVNSEYVDGLIASGGSFQSYAAAELEAAGASEELAAQLADNIDQAETYDAAVAELFGTNKSWAESNRGLIEGLEGLDDVVGSLNIEDMAQDFLSAQRGIEGERAAVDEAINSTNSYADALLAYIEIKKQQNAAELEGAEQEEMRQAFLEGNRAATDEYRAMREEATAADEEAARVLAEELKRESRGG